MAKFYLSLMIGILCFICSPSIAQKNFPTKTLEVQVNRHNQTYYRHNLKASETLYGLSKYFGISIEDLLIINKIDNAEDLAVGTIVTIPINKKAISTDNTRLSKTLVPLIYKVKNKETLYKISNVFFPQPMENLISRNNIHSFALKKGQELVIGYWQDQSKAGNTNKTLKDKLRQASQQQKEETEIADNQPVDKEAQNELLQEKKDQLLRLIKEIKEVQASDGQISDREISSEESALDSLIDSANSEFEIDSLEFQLEEKEIDKKRINQKGIAIWDKSGNDRTNLFVMYNDAKPNSFIRLRYGVTNREVTAKVVCPIPDGLYAQDVDIILTPGVALALGALDSRFQINMEYYE